MFFKLFTRFFPFSFGLSFANETALAPSTRSGSAAGAQFDYVIPETWKKRLHFDVWVTQFLSKFEGGSYKGYEGYGSSNGFSKKDKKGINYRAGGQMTGMPIKVQADAFKKSGDIIHIQVAKGLFQSFQTNDNTLRGNEASMRFGQFDIGIDAYRAATAFTQTVDELTMTDNPALAYMHLKDLAARKMDALSFAELLFGGGTATSGTSFTTPTAYAGTATSTATVISSEATLDIQTLIKGYYKLMAQGAAPISVNSVSMINGVSKEIPEYVAVMSLVDEYNLSLDSTYENYMLNARERSEMNPLFKGGVAAKINGLYLYCLPDPFQGDVRIGCALRPETRLSSAAGTGTGTWSVGSRSDVEYTLYFPSSGQLAVYDSGGNIVEVVTYTSKTDNTFVVSARADSGTATNHASNTFVTLVTGRVLLLGANALLKSYGKPTHFIKQIEDYEEEHGFGVRFVVGNQGMLDSEDNPRNFLVIETFSSRDFSIS